MDPFTGHYPKTEQESHDAGINTHLSLLNGYHEYQLVCSRYNPVVVTADVKIHPSIPQKLYCSFHHWLPWYVMLYSHTSTTEKNPYGIGLLWNSIFCWVPPRPPSRKTTSAELSHSSHEVSGHAWMARDALETEWQNAGTIPALQSTTEALWIPDRLPSNPPGWFLEINLALTSISAQSKTFSQWSESSLCYRLCYWFLPAVTVSGTSWRWTLS